MELNFSDQKLNEQQNSIFLAGPTVRGRTYHDSWRKKACDMLEVLGFGGIVYIPEYRNKVFDSSREFETQALWERYALMSAGAILFYMDRHMPDVPGLTTNTEFGMYITKKPEQCVLCIPEGSQKNRYIEWLYNVEIPLSKRVNPICHTMEEALKTTIAVTERVCTPIEALKAKNQ